MGDRTVRIAVEGDETVYKIPNHLIRSMENVGTILVHVNTLDILAINIASRVGAFVNHDNLFPLLFGKKSERSPK